LQEIIPDDDQKSYEKLNRIQNKMENKYSKAKVKFEEKYRICKCSILGV